MIVNENQKVNVMTRALIIHEDHILITKWKNDFSFSDSPKLSIQFVPIEKLEDFMFYPKFLINYIKNDYKNNFKDCPKHIYSNELTKEYIVKEMYQTL